MLSQQKQYTRPTSYPTGWPTDGRSHMTEFEGIYFLTHPERNPHRRNVGEANWKEIMA